MRAMKTFDLQLVIAKLDCEPHLLSSYLVL